MLEVEVFVSDDITESLPFDIERLGKYAVGILESRGIETCDINVVFIDDTAMAGLNESYKQREGTTDVLSFLLSEEGESVSGEVYVSLERAKAQASEYGVGYAEETVRLVTHGLLHLTGMVHDTDEAFEAMTSLTNSFVDGFMSREG